MHIRLLELLRCPFCGTRLHLIDNAALERHDDEIASGVLGCECCAFPIVAGIPVLVANDATRTAMHALEAGDGDTALTGLLELDERRAEQFRSLLARGDAATYREALAILSQDEEGTYFVYRLSDPTFLLAQALVQAFGGAPAVRSRYLLDLCGGSGHLTRVMAGLRPAGGTLLADLYYWKLWLARQFTSPGCEAVCCDANHPLPLARGACSMVVLSDAFPYIWHKRLLADEMMRAAGDDGVVLMPHLHSALGENFTAGMPLTPAAYADLFQPMRPRLFGDGALLTTLLDDRRLDLRHPPALETLDGVPSLTVVATRHDDLLARYDVPADEAVGGELIVNPLYAIEPEGNGSRLTLRFPTPEYEAEFGGCRRYLPDTLLVPGDLRRPLSPAAFGRDYAELRRRQVLIDAPRRYC